MLTSFITWDAWNVFAAVFQRRLFKAETMIGRATGHARIAACVVPATTENFILISSLFVLVIQTL